MNKLEVSIQNNGIGYCLYCRLALNDPNEDYHIPCHEQIEVYKLTVENQERITLEKELIELRAMRAEERSERAKKRADTIAYNKEHQLERINHITYYQFLDEYDCIIFVCYDTIVGVLHNHKFYTVENNFSQTTARQIDGVLPYGGIPKIEKRSFINYDGKEHFYDKTVYTNHLEVPIREFERILSDIGISHLQRIGEGTRGNYYYDNKSYDRTTGTTWLSVCDSSPFHNEPAINLENWIKHDLDFNKERYDIYLKVGTRDIGMKIWDRKLMKYKTLGRTRRKWTPEDKEYYPFTEVWKYGFRPLKKLLLKQKGFKEIT